MRPLLRQRCRACGSEVLEGLFSGMQAWECRNCGLGGGRELAAARWRQLEEQASASQVDAVTMSAEAKRAADAMRWKTALNALRRAQMLLLMLRWGLDLQADDDPRIGHVRLSVLVWSSKCLREAGRLVGGWLYVSADERWDLFEFEASLDRDLRVLTGEVTNVFASNASFLEALVERHLSSMQLLVDRSEHLDVAIT
ncbi:hypothetical protein G6O69_29070 [Pseudenhygromyxa sp. WMMC2535]|uniref:hypothetical protein n=1 Tax=Pseudenhygromyxa sp. WMMC2535 TaxID=2712867 RepID=UPI001555878C|nr:hypothetical protein [Pseudenhygromyxa sp. WMMC2535]NVB41918.1 hypothetical protein [Pseudenhygromyxa sp. WMMC2535]